ncbi:GGDEF domain-containing protein [Stutzerimonas tarimensis]|uniref:diguanylate cyclase n=1 Tax=Stutzerimonas tarimensis TaxID=1507735 RepID=A0ABV7T6P1_9GAMM
MPSDLRRSPDDLRETPYQRQAVLGFRLLLFKPALEVEFRRYLTQQARLTQRLGGVALVLVAGGYLFFEHILLGIEEQPWSLELTLLRALQMLVGGVVLLVSFDQRRQSAFSNWLLGFLLILVGVIASQIDLFYETSELPLKLRYGAGLLIVCCFFYLGVTFWWALLCAMVILAGDVVLAKRALSPDQYSAHLIAVSYYLLLMAIGSISRYAHEYSQREQFLMRKQLGWMAEHDGLTGLSNRRSFDAALRRAVAQARREHLPLTLMLLDLDEFKAYNDTLGHPEGDRLLQDFSDLFERFARRPLDLAARVGGEEFALLLYDCDAAAGRQLAEDILQRVRDRAFPHPASRRGTLTCSIGMAVLRGSETPERLYKHADDALYMAKQQGRDRGVLHHAG